MRRYLKVGIPIPIWVAPQKFENQLLSRNYRDKGFFILLL